MYLDNLFFSLSENNSFHDLQVKFRDKFIGDQCMKSEIPCYI